MTGRHRRALALITLAVAVVGPIAAEEELVTVFSESRDDRSVVLRASSGHIVPVYLTVNLPRLINMEADVELPFGVQLEPGSEGVELFTLSPTASQGRIGYSVSYSYARGNPETADHDDDFRYVVPFAHGEKRRLSQGFGGRFSHYGENEYAIDFEMPEGTPVFAAREGIVAEVKDDSRAGGTSASYADDANYILVMHEDGSFANYAHLRHGGADVEPGDRVSEGQLVGYSGNTGRSSGPHLHFDVRIPTREGRMQSIPFLLRGPDGEALAPEEGRFYYAYHPGGPEFRAEFGRDILASDFDGYAEPFTAREEVDVRVEQVDLTFVLFVRNGYERRVDVEIALDLRGLRSDNGRRITRTVPPQTELFLTILRPIDGASSIQYGYSLRPR